MAKEGIKVILYGKLVDVTYFSASHPGGAEILKSFQYRDATDQFEAMHSPEAKQQLTNVFLPKSPLASSVSRTTPSSTLSFEVSESANGASIWAAGTSLKEERPTISSYAENQISKDFAVLRKTLEEKGLFKTDILKESLSALYTLFMYALGGYLIFFTQNTYWGLFSLMMAFYMSGWIAHDYLHHAVLPSVYWNEIIGDFFSIMQGYEKTWWKLRHNQHHVTTNECAHDPDIAIAPLFHFVQQYPDIKSRLNSLQKYQHLYFLPFLALLDFDWRYESITCAINVYPKDKAPVIKLSLHYMALMAVIKVVGFWPIVAVMVGRGFLTAIIVFSSHYSEQRLVGNTQLSLVEQTAHTSRNISGGFLMNFFSGNISLQIEHHLFPTMPPHNLVLATPYVKQFLKEHNLPYHENSIVECTGRLLSSLNIHSGFKL